MRLIHAEGSGVGVLSGGLDRNSPFWTNSQGALGVRPSGVVLGIPQGFPQGGPLGGSPMGIPPKILGR